MFRIRLSKSLMDKSVHLDSIGIREIAWRKDSSLQVLEILSTTKAAILGGDVFEIRNNKIIPLSENWYCEKLQNENQDDFAKRSQNIAKNYIINFPIHKNEIILFTIVIQDGLFQNEG